MQKKYGCNTDSMSETGYGILQYYLAIYEKDTGKSLIDTYGFYGTLSFLHYLISIVALLVMIVMFQNWKETQEEQRGQELVLNQISDMKKHIGEVEKLRESKEKQIRFLTDFHYPENTELNAFDLSVIMNNALNNCMENVSGNDPYISVSSFRENSIFLITIKNSFQEQLHFGDSGLPETTKSGKGHGIGLNNIRRVARMYMGDISFEQGKGEVVLSIMMQIG